MSPLAGRTIVVTRPREQAGPLCDGIAAAGGSALIFPLLEIQEVPDDPDFRVAIAALDRAALAIFISPNAVNFGLPAARRIRPWPAGPALAAVGQGTANALQAQGFPQVIMPPSGFDSEALLACPELSAAAVDGRIVVVFKGEGGRDLLASTLTGRGATVLVAPCYRRLPPVGDPAQLVALYRAGQLDGIVLSSSEAVRHFGALLAPAEQGLLDDTPVFCPHPRIGEAAAAIGCKRICLTAAGDAGILAGLSEYNWLPNERCPMNERTEVNLFANAEAPGGATLPVGAPVDTSANVGDPVSEPVSEPIAAADATAVPPLPPRSAPPASSATSAVPPPPNSPPKGSLLDRLPPWRGFGGVMLIGLVLIALLGWQWLELRQRVEQTQQQLARRLVEGAAQLRDARALADTAQEALKSQATRITVLEAKLGELNTQQAALEGLYQELSRGRDEWLLSEVDQLVGLAAQQLQLAGNVQGAVLALANAEERLARSARPQLIALRKAIGKDLQKLRNLPLVDVGGIALRLENAALAIDQMTFAFEARPSAALPPTVKIKARDTREIAPADWTQWWDRWTSEVWQEVHNLIRIERLDRPDPALLAPQNAVFLKENVKLRLLGARLALLSRDQASFKGELRQAVQWFDKYFDGRDRRVAGTLESLRPLLATELSIEPPALSESQNALRAVKLSADRIVR